MSSIPKFINNLHSLIYCSCALHILFHSEPKITQFYLLSFVFIRFHWLYHSLSFVVIHYHSLYHSLSFVVSLVVTRCHSLSLVVIRCHSLSYSLSFVVPLVVIRSHSLYHSLSLNVLLVCLFINDRARRRDYVNSL